MCSSSVPIFCLFLNSLFASSRLCARSFLFLAKPDLRKMTGGRPNLLFGPFPSERCFEFFLGEELPRGARVFPHDTLEVFASLFDE